MIPRSGRAGSHKVCEHSVGNTRLVVLKPIPGLGKSLSDGAVV